MSAAVVAHRYRASDSPSRRRLCIPPATYVRDPPWLPGLDQVFGRRLRSPPIRETWRASSRNNDPPMAVVPSGSFQRAARRKGFVGWSRPDRDSSLRRLPRRSLAQDRGHSARQQAIATKPEPSSRHGCAAAPWLRRLFRVERRQNLRHGANPGKGAAAARFKRGDAGDAPRRIGNPFDQERGRLPCRGHVACSPDERPHLSRSCSIATAASRGTARPPACSSML